LGETVSTQDTKKFNIKEISLKKLNNVEVREQFIRLRSQQVSSFGKFRYVNNKMAWKNIRQYKTFTQKEYRLL
jgi:hypothetical protein